MTVLKNIEMKIFLTKQKLNKHLNLLKNETVMLYNKIELQEKISIQQINTNKQLSEIDLEFLYNYEIFPNYIMSHYSQWKEENRKMNIEDTIVQQVYIPPIQSLSQKIIFGVRINEIINENNRKGFSYETLNGHVEKGISTFTIEQIENKIYFKIHTFSKPGNLLSKILGPIFSVPYQAYCTKKAINYVTEQIEKQ